jgi:hypothetical protein
MAGASVADEHLASVAHGRLAVPHAQVVRRAPQVARAIVRSLVATALVRYAPPMPTDLSGRRIVVTGGAGFLGRAVLDRLRARGCRDIVVPRRAEYDLTHEADAARLYDDARPDVVIHLAAEVGGIGANMANPGRYFFANMAMALHLIEQARIRSLEEVRAGRDDLRVSEVHAGPVPRGGAVERLPRGDQRAVRRRQEGGAGDARRLPAAVRAGQRLRPAGQSLRTA